jgi:LytS/YehU family sensor histidine kinase
MIKVPPMLIQPYVENAIWHGLLHKAEKGTVTINCIKYDGALQIVIEDDGIGREKAVQLKSKNSTSTKSYGMQITAQRIEQLNSKNKVETFDLKDAEGNALGTKVVLTIYTYNES